MRKRLRKENKQKSRKVNLQILGRVVLFLLLLSVLILIGRGVINILSIKVIDYTKINSSTEYILSKNSTDLKKTLIVFEEGLGEKRKISHAYLYVENSKKKNGMLVYIPSNLYFNGLEEEFGNKIPISSLKYAGDYLQKGRGVEYALWQFAQLLGLKYDDYIWITSEGVSALNQTYGNVSDVDSGLTNIYSYEKDFKCENDFLFLNSVSKKINFSRTLIYSDKLSDLNGEIYSSKSFSDIMNLLKGINRKVKEYKVYTLDLSNEMYSKEEDLNSGGKAKVLDSKAYDEVFRERYGKMIGSALEKERGRIEVYNGSDISGIASQLGRKIENSGGDVIRYGNAPSSVEKTKVYVPNIGEYGNTFKLVSEILSGRFEVVEDRPSFMTTGDVVIILGKDIKFMYSF